MVEVVVSRSVKVNLGDYQATDFFVSMRDEAPEGETFKTQARLRRLVDRALIADISAHFKARGKAISVQDICKRFGFEGKKS